MGVAPDIDVMCLHCGALVRVITVSYGTVDEQKWFDCPDCRRPLFSSKPGTIYDIDRVIKHGSPPASRNSSD